MSIPESSLIGYLTEVQGARLTAVLLSESAGVGAAVSIGAEVQAVGQLGSIVEIWDDAGHLLAQISRVWEDEQQAAPMTASGAQVPGARRRRVELVPLGEIGSNGSVRRGVSRFPVLGATVHAIGSRRLGTLLEGSREGAFDFGRLSVRPELKGYLDPSILFGRHLAILGQTGSGKSWTVASLLQRMVATMPRCHIVLLDLHGEYGWQREDGSFMSAFPRRSVRHIDARELEIPYWLLSYAELVDLLVDRTDPNATVQIAYLQEVLFSLRQQANRQLGLERLSVDSPVYFSFDELFQRLKKANEEKQDFGRTKGPMFGAFDDLLVRCQSFLNDSRYDFFLRPKRHQESASLELLLRDFVGLGEPKRQLTVIDLSPVPADLRPVVSAQIGRLAFEFNYWNPWRAQFPMLLVCEEAHQYIPRDDQPQYAGTRRAMERIAKEGRKYGVSLCVVSQRPTELSETVLSQCTNFLCLRITNANDQDYIRRLLPEGAQGLVNLLASLRQGEVLAIGDAAALPVRVLVYPPDPAPVAREMNLTQAWSEGPQDLDVGAIVDRWWRQLR